MLDVDATACGGPVDGRIAGRQRRQDLVVGAVIELFETGQYWPPGATVAERAGVSLRSVFRYFNDITLLYVTALHTYRARLGSWDLDRPALSWTMPERVIRIVRHHVGLATATAAYRHAVRAHAVDLAVVAPLARQWDTLAWDHIGDWFAPELEGYPAQERIVVHATLAAGVHPDHIDLLGCYQLDADQTERALTRQLASSLRGLPRTAP